MCRSGQDLQRVYQLLTVQEFCNSVTKRNKEIYNPATLRKVQNCTIYSLAHFIHLLQMHSLMSCIGLRISVCAPSPQHVLYTLKERRTVHFSELELTLEEYGPCKLHSLQTSFTILPTEIIEILQTQLITTYGAINDRSGKLINVGDSIQLRARV